MFMLVKTMKTTAAFRLDPALLNAMRGVKDTDGIPVTTQIEMAVRAWLKTRGIIVPKIKPTPKAAHPRRTRA